MASAAYNIGTEAGVELHMEHTGDRKLEADSTLKDDNLDENLEVDSYSQTSTLPLLVLENNSLSFGQVGSIHKNKEKHVHRSQISPLCWMALIAIFLANVGGFATIGYICHTLQEDVVSMKGQLASIEGVVAEIQSLQSRQSNASSSQTISEHYEQSIGNLKDELDRAVNSSRHNMKVVRDGLKIYVDTKVESLNTSIAQYMTIMMSSESRTKTMLDSMNLRINSTSSSIKQDMRDITSNTTRKLRDEFNTKLEVCESTYAGLANQLAEFINSTNENHVKGQLDITDLSNDLSDLETEVNTLRDDCNTKISNIQADVELGINTTVESIQQQFDGKLAALVSQMAANISLVQSILMENSATADQMDMTDELRLLADVHGFDLSFLRHMSSRSQNTCYRCTESSPCTTSQLTNNQNPLAGCWEGVIQSDGYPLVYRNNTQQHWNIQNPGGNIMVLTILDFELEYCCNCDYLEVFGGKICGDGHSHQARTYHVTGLEQIRMSFISDNSVTRKGFKIKFKFH